MRIIYAIIFAFIAHTTVHAQAVLTPLEGQPAIRAAAAEKRAAFTDKYGTAAVGEKADCPPDVFFANTVIAGESITIQLDTTGSNFMGDSLQSTEILPCSVLNSGTSADTGGGSTRIPTTIDYTADAGVITGFDTICVKVCAFNSQCDTFNLPVFVRRPGTSYDVEGPSLNAFEVMEEFCVDETVLEGEILCSEVLFCEDDYDGEGQQNVRPALYSITSPCIFYEASGFPGQDLVCFELCDEFGICDTFNITYTIANETLELPFFDDFSNNEGVYPSRAFWLDNQVYINNHMAPNPPSVGVATFDGLDSEGTPYDFTGQGDDLTSKYIDLSGFDAADNVFFKAYVAPRGLSFLPNFADSLVLEFRDADRNWEEVGSWAGIANPTPDFEQFPWEFFARQIDEERFLHDAFQFRFISYHSPGGVTDTWHVDYIKIEANDNDTPIFNDVAFTREPGTILDRYYSMPWKQFAADISGEIRDDELTSSYFNHSFEDRNLSADSRINITDLVSGTTLAPEITVTNAASINSQEYLTVSRNPDGFWTGVAAALNDFSDDTERAELKLQYEFTLNDQDPLAFRNDTVSTVTHLDNYYAYDDGTGELAFYLVNQQGEEPEFAVRYQTNVEDQLQGVRVQFPRMDAEGEQGQFFSIKVWVDPSGSEDFTYLNDNEPDFIREFVNPFYPDTFTDTLQGFTTYALEDALGVPAPLTIPAGATFYLGFQQTSVAVRGIHTGYDIQNNANEHTFLNLGGDWFQMPPEFNGAHVYQPIFGNETTGNTAIKETLIQTNSPLRVYPNPTSGTINLTLQAGNYHDFNLQIFNQYGQTVRTGDAVNQLEMNNLANGIYYLQLTNKETRRTYFEKVVLAR